MYYYSAIDVYVALEMMFIEKGKEMQINKWIKRENLILKISHIYKSRIFKLLIMTY